MLYLIAKAVISGVIIMAASEIAKRSPTCGSLILSLPLISILALIDRRLPGSCRHGRSREGHGRHRHEAPRRSFCSGRRPSALVLRVVLHERAGHRLRSPRTDRRRLGTVARRDLTLFSREPERLDRPPISPSSV